MRNRYVFFRIRDGLDTYNDIRTIREGYRSEFRRPTIRFFSPPPNQGWASPIWALAHYTYLFSNRDCAVLLIKCDNKIVHRSWVFPRYFRFPFMADDDLQIGDIWTAPHHRQQGLATFALRLISNTFRKTNRSFWFVTVANNAASIRVAEKAGFAKYGEGVRTKRMGLRVFGSFIIEDKEQR